MIEIRIGRYRLLGIPMSLADDLDQISVRLGPISVIAADVLPPAILFWLNQRDVPWQLVRRRKMHPRQLVMLESVLQICDDTAARAFEVAWGCWLRGQYLADLQADAEACRQRAEAAFDRFVAAPPESAVHAAYDLLLAERLRRRSVGSVARFEAFGPPLDWYRVGERHTEYFAVQYDIVPPNRDRHRDMKLGRNLTVGQRKPLCLRTRSRDVRVGIWQRLRAHDRPFSVDRTLTATRQAFTDAGGYVAVYRPRACHAFLFERYVPDSIEFLPSEVATWLHCHTPGWRFTDRCRDAGGNTAWQDSVLVFERRDDAEAFRARWALFLASRHEAGMQRELARAEESLGFEIIACKAALPHQRSKQTEAVLDAERRRYRLACLLASGLSGA